MHTSSSGPEEIADPMLEDVDLVAQAGVFDVAAVGGTPLCDT